MPHTVTLIQKHFNQVAKSYDFYSGLHRQIADKLIGDVYQLVNVTNGSCHQILDVGCGTGYLTGKLKSHFGQSKITGLDFSQAMLDEAATKTPQVEWVLGDSHRLPFSDGDFDLVVSNLAYQWAQDLFQVFGEARRVLKPEGQLLATLFGFHTCQELFQSLQEAGSALQFKRLTDESQIAQALAMNGFSDFRTESESVTIEFESLHDLLGWLKSIGANNLSRQGFLGKHTLQQAARIYRKEFAHLKGVGATFEIIRVYAKR